MKTIKIVCCIKLFFCCLFLASQDSPSYILDSIHIDRSYKEIQNLFYKYEEVDSILADEYARIYLNKAKKDKDSYKIAKGYLFLSYINNNDKGLKYTDSAITLTKNNKDPYFPTAGYLSKGYILFQKCDYKRALDNFIQAYEYAKEKNNVNDLLLSNLLQQ